MSDDSLLAERVAAAHADGNRRFAGPSLLLLLVLASSALAADEVPAQPDSFGSQPVNLYGNGGEVSSLAWSPDGKSLVAARARLVSRASFASGMR